MDLQHCNRGLIKIIPTINVCILVDSLSCFLAHHQRVLSITVCLTLCCFHLNRTSQWTVPALNAESYKLNLWSPQKGEPGVMKQVKA